MVNYYYDIIQGSDKWNKIRLGKLTASNATAIGANGTGLMTYCREIVGDIVNPNHEKYINDDMIRGNELEPIARQVYEFETLNFVEECGFITNDSYPNVGLSPDGLIGDDGGCEIKARNYNKHRDLIFGIEKDIPFNQIQMSLLVSERKWWDFVSYNPEHKKPIFIKRIYPDAKYHEKLKVGFIAGNDLILKYKEAYFNYKPETNN